MEVVIELRQLSKLKNPNVPIDINLKEYDAPEQRYCPAGVYEILRNEQQQTYLQYDVMPHF